MTVIPVANLCETRRGPTLLNMRTTTSLPTYFISHGGGPWPYIPEMRSMFRYLEASLIGIVRELREEPRAVLVVSGHWTEKDFAVTSNPRPPMVYDYSGFPPYTYQVQYPAPGDPALAQQVQHLLQRAGFDSSLDPTQGYDHGTFTPLVIMYPEANVPVVQLSMKSGYDPAEHIAVGRAIAKLREENVLIVGSGLSYHNMRAMSPAGEQASKTFDQWLQQTLIHTTGKTRSQKLIEWSAAPAARQAHPREDHLIPLMVATGAAEGEQGALVYHEEGLFGGITASSFRFGEVPRRE
jgi:aromatic ring-opening dioxygenase catalytic subunit (LigB family)